MKKILLPLAAVLLLSMAVPAFAYGPRGEWELGLSWTPSKDANNVTDPNAVNSILGFHVGYAWSVLYFSWDAYAMPDYWVSNMTGYYAPGFLNLFDVGLRFVIRPILAYAEVGGNNLFIYGSQDYGNIGVNARVGVGLKFGWWGINVSGTQVFGNWDDLSAAFSDAARGDWSTLTDGSTASLNFAIYF
jgi:hypothetical protein